MVASSVNSVQHLDENTDNYFKKTIHTISIFDKNTFLSLFSALLSKSEFRLVTKTINVYYQDNPSRHWLSSTVFFLYFCSRMFPSRLLQTGMLFHFF